MYNKKYPRTPHLSYSPGKSSDDLSWEDCSYFLGKQVVVSEKLDGESTGLTRKHCHARSLDSKDHPSRHWIKVLHRNIAHLIPENWKVFGENLFACHSIFYNNLPSYFFVYGIYNEQNFCINWQETKEWCALLDLCTVPVIYEGIWDEELVKSRWDGKSIFGGESEGYVVRIVDGFAYDNFWYNCAKYVRKNHVQTDEHWLLKTIVPNRLK